VNQRYFAALLGFAFVAAWIGLDFGSALLCLLGAAVGYAAALFLTGEVDVEEVRDRIEGARVGMQQPRRTRAAATAPPSAAPTRR
jgi:hypothetical protein